MIVKSFQMGLMILFFVTLSIFLVSPASYGQDPIVTVNINHDYKETTYSIKTKADQHISLTTYQTDLNKGILRLRSTSNLPLNIQVNLLGTILKRVLRDSKKEEFHTLSIGRLIHAFGKNSSDMAKRLALFANRSKEWDPIRGKPVSGHKNEAVKIFANQAPIFKELTHLFDRHGFLLRVSSVEKVLIGKPEIIPFGKHLIEKGVSTTAKLPFDGLMWFSINKIPENIYLGGGYWKGSSKIYWKWRKVKDTRNKKPGEIEYTVHELKGADANSFKLIAERVEGVWGGDKHGIYFFHEPIEGVDRDTWVPFDWGYSKDKNYVYNGSKRLDGANPKTFKIPPHN